MNEHAMKVLDAYLDAVSLSVPHAVLIEGRWGSGKTYFLQKVYEPTRRQRMVAEQRHHVPFLFVSLFGASSANDVEMRIYKTACPAEAVVGSVAGTITLGVGEFFRVKDAAKGVIDKLGKKAIRRLNDFIFVFDDLERVEKDAFGEVMGLINSLVADHGRRVILVTDEDKLLKLGCDEIWKDQNEKLVGRRARIEADLESVINASISGLSKGASKLFLEDHQAYLLEVAKTSKVENLRSLSWAMHNAAAFVKCLVHEQDIPKSHVKWTMGLVLATTLWMRSGKLDAETLEKIPGLSRVLAIRSMAHKKAGSSVDTELERAKDFSETFVSLSVDAPPLDYSFIKHFENSGVLDQSQVIFWIKSQFGFGDQYKEAAWRRLWYSHERPISQTEEAIAELKDELQRRIHTEQGPILHAAGLAIRQSKVDDHRLTDNEDIVLFFKRYIDDVAKQGALERGDTGAFAMRLESYAGLGFSSRESEKFREILEYIKMKSMEAAFADLEERANTIFVEAEAGNLKALHKFLDSNDYELSRKPILMNFPSERLAEFMAKDFPNLNAGAQLLAYRYYRANSGDELLKELPWARNVYAKAVEKISHWSNPYREMALDELSSTIRHYEKDKDNKEKIIPSQETSE